MDEILISFLCYWQKNSVTETIHSMYILNRFGGAINVNDGSIDKTKDLRSINLLVI